MVKIDLGCGTRKREGFIGVDCRPFEGVDVVTDIGDMTKPWPWEDNSVDEIHASHFVEHLTAQQRIHFVNECYRVLKPGAIATVITPHWASCRAYGDLTHQWPPVAESWFFHLSATWRKTEAPHNDDIYRCDFECTWVYSLHASLVHRNVEYQNQAVNFWKEAAQDMQATLKKR